LLAICDNRLVSTGYGKRLLGAMPDMRRIDTLQDWDASLQNLASTRLSTKAF